MDTKRILIYLPLGLVLFLAQSFFWVPTYDKQAVGNPNRLVKYIHGSAADAEILNPILSADTTSSSITGLVFDGLIDLDDKLDYRPRLASSWVQYEEAYLVVPSNYQDEKIPSDAHDFGKWIQTTLKPNSAWSKNLKSIEVIAGKKITGQVTVPALDGEGRPVMEKGRPKTRKLDYSLRQPDRIKFTLHKIDQDFFKPVEKLLGAEFFQSFPYAQYIHAEDSSEQKNLAGHYQEILPLTEHNPIIVFDLEKVFDFMTGMNSIRATCCSPIRRS